MSTESEKKGIEASFKSMDTEEFLDIYFNRPIGYAWALFFKKLKVHPNVVTIFSIILGIGAGVMFYYPDMKHTLLGILLLMWANQDNFKQQREIFYSLPWKGNFWWKAFLYFYGNYTRQQERMTPNFQQFYALVKEKYGDNIPQELRDEFRAASKPLMKYTNILTFNTRAIALYISLLIGEPWLYFVFEVVVMTSLFVYMRHCHEAICARLYHKYITK